MKLTCVTATFNCIKSGNRDKLVRCVESVAALKIDHEHLVYDGASADGTRELLFELERRTPGLTVVSEPDTGIYNALNKGVRDAKGEWFYVLGADDYIVSEDNMQTALDEGGAAEADIVVTPVYTSENLTTKLRINKKNAIGTMPYPHQGMLMRTTAVRALKGFNEEFPITADYDMVLRALLQDKKTILRDGLTFASYSNCGTSIVNKAVALEEFNAIVSRNLCLPEKDAVRYSKRNLLPLGKCLWLMSCKSSALKASARYYTLRWIANCLGLLRKNGTLIWH